MPLKLPGSNLLSSGKNPVEQRTTKSVFKSAMEVFPENAVGAGSGINPVFILVGNEDASEFSCSFKVPRNIAEKHVQFKLWWYSIYANGNISLTWNLQSKADGDAIAGGVSTITDQNDATNGSQIMNVTTMTDSLGNQDYAVEPEEVIGINVERDSSLAGDTLVQDAKVVGIEMTYV